MAAKGPSSINERESKIDEILDTLGETEDIKIKKGFAPAVSYNRFPELGAISEVFPGIENYAENIKTREELIKLLNDKLKTGEVEFDKDAYNDFINFMKNQRAHEEATARLK